MTETFKSVLKFAYLYSQFQPSPGPLLRYNKIRKPSTGKTFKKFFVNPEKQENSAFEVFNGSFLKI